jgi:Rrf2 family protein
MKISAQEEYGLRCLLQIGRLADAGGTTIEEVSRAEGMTPSYTAKLLRILRMNGFVTSIRGKTGGYTLARPAEEIVIGDVLNALGGRLFEGSFCEHFTGQNGTCVHFEHCSLRSFWCAIQSVLDHVLGQTTLQNLMDPNDLSWWQACLTANPLMQDSDDSRSAQSA